nr:immunoglobulin light chain junction region [Macaca mulatta]
DYYCSSNPGTNTLF